MDFTIWISKFLFKRSQSDGCCGGDHYYLVLFTVTSDLFPRGHNVPPTICSDYTRISFFLCFYLFHSKLFVLCNEDRRRIFIARVDVVFICVIVSCIYNIYILTTVNNVETIFVFFKQVFVYFHCSLILPDFNWICISNSVFSISSLKLLLQCLYDKLITILLGTDFCWFRRLR